MNVNPKKIVIVNDGLSPNKGDQAILHGMLSSLKADIPTAEIRVFPNSNMSSLRQYVEFWRALKDADIFIFGGGQEIQDHASVAFLISGLLKIALAKIRRKPVFCYAIGVGPVASRLGKLLTRHVLNRVDFITVRDKDSRAYLRELGVTNPAVSVAADPAILLAPVEKERARRILREEGIDENREPRIAIAPRRWFHYRHYFIPMRLRTKLCSLQGQEEYSRLIGILAQVADHLAYQHRAQIIFLPMRSVGSNLDPGQDDDRVSREIINLMKMKDRAYLLQGDYSPEELKAVFGRMNLVISMRMHAVIMASMMGVPVIGLNISPKFASFFRMIGQESYLIDVQHVDFHSLLTTIETALSNREQIADELRSQAQVLHGAASSNNRFLEELLGLKTAVIERNDCCARGE